MSMLNKKYLKEMINFTNNKNKTFKLAIILFFQSLPYLLFYQNYTLRQEKKLIKNRALSA